MVRANLAGNVEKPGAINFTNQGANITPKILRTLKIPPKNVHTIRANLKASKRDFKRDSEKMGTNTITKLPSANKRLHKLGRRNATKKASAAKPVPKK